MNLGAAEKTSPPVSQVCEASGSSFFLPVRQALFRALQQNCFPDRFTAGTGRKVFLNAAKKTPGSCHRIAPAIVCILWRQTGL
jgi:hypothetical protein